MDLVKKSLKDKKELTLLQQVYRFFAFLLAQGLKHTPITPNFISVVNFLAGLLAALAFAFGNPIAGILFGQAAVFLDFADGALARAKNMSSEFGLWLELILGDRIADVFIILGIVLSLNSTTAWIFGCLFVAGRLFLNSINDYISLYPNFSQIKEQITGKVYSYKGTFGKVMRQFVYTRVNHYIILTLGVIFNHILLALALLTVYVWFFFVTMSITFTIKARKVL